jgi:hypothetical protein
MGIAFFTLEGGAAFDADTASKITPRTAQPPRTVRIGIIFTALSEPITRMFVQFREFTAPVRELPDRGSDQSPSAFPLDGDSTPVTLWVIGLSFPITSRGIRHV